MGALQELTALGDLASNPAVDDWKRSGGKAMGFLCSYVPEEILYAAGILPVRLRAPGCTATSSADRYLSHLNCTYVRACLQFVLDGRFGVLDGFVGANSCDHARRLYDILEEIGCFDFTHVLSIPHKVDGEATARWFAGELDRFRQSLEKGCGVRITEDDLERAFEAYNETRALLRRLYHLRKSEHPALSGSEMLSVVIAGYALPREAYSRLLARLLDELADRPKVPEYRARLMIAGSGGCDEPGYLRITEDLGGLIVADSLCCGSRSLLEPVKTGNDPMLNLARSYLARPSCASMTDRTAERAEYVIRTAREFDVDGVVFQRIRYCDLWGGQLLYLRKALKEANLPLLTLEREYGTQNLEQARTRVQAFLEQIGR